MTDIPGTITATVPFTIRHHGGRKQVITPDGRPALAPPRARVDSALVKALGRAFRWRRLLDTGAYATIEEIAAAEGINPSYVIPTALTFDRCRQGSEVLLHAD